jgi:integrase
VLDKHILPVWRDREFTTLRKSDIAALLDRIEDESGARTADWALDIARAVMNWFAARHDDYNAPQFRGMRRRTIEERRRERILDDDELRRVWRAASEAGTFGAFVKILLLTAQRREKVLNMRWDDVDKAGVWTIPTAPREKQSAGVLKLSAAARAIIAAQPRFAGNPYVFAGRTDGPISSGGKWKRRLDTASGVTGWVLHDLRRTARSLMSRAGVQPHIAERVLGHAIVGVEGVYDRHSYRDEKATALDRLAEQIDTILNAADDKVVVPLAAHKNPRRDKALAK